MKKRGLAVVLCMLMVCAPASAQAIPGAPAAPAAPGAATTGTAAATTAAPAAPQGGLAGFCDALKKCCEDCKQKCCASPLGQILNNMTMPLSLATGGLIGPLCPPNPTQSQLQQLLGPDSTASDAEKTAASIKADEAGAAARKAAIRYLGTVDCHYYPEAQDALISGLRGDRNECVRYEAALALSKGCCCTKKTMAALLVVVNGTDSDGHPAETSARVKEMAAQALERCTCVAGASGSEPRPPERPGEPPEGPGVAKQADSGIHLATYYTNQPAKQAQSELVDQANRYIAATISTTPDTRGLASGQRDLLSIFSRAVNPPSPTNEVDAYEAAVLGPDTAASARPAPPRPAAAAQSAPRSAPPPAPAPPPATEPCRPLQLLAPSAILQPTSH
jgi:hypothetical protein